VQRDETKKEREVNQIITERIDVCEGPHRTKEHPQCELNTPLNGCFKRFAHGKLSAWWLLVIWAALRLVARRGTNSYRRRKTNNPCGQMIRATHAWRHSGRAFQGRWPALCSRHSRRLSPCRHVLKPGLEVESLMRPGCWLTSAQLSLAIPTIPKYKPVRSTASPSPYGLQDRPEALCRRRMVCHRKQICCGVLVKRYLPLCRWCNATAISQQATAKSHATVLFRCVYSWCNAITISGGKHYV